LTGLGILREKIEHGGPIVLLCCTLNCILSPRQSAQLLYNEKEVYVCYWNPDNIGDDRNHFAFQAVQKSFQLALVTGHADIESMHSVSDHYQTSRNVRHAP